MKRTLPALLPLLLLFHGGSNAADPSPGEPVTRGRTAMVTGTGSPASTRAAVETLKRGGSAVDAALTAALAHTTMAGGCTVSFAGVITLVYYDAQSGKVFALDGGYNTVRGETDPISIPRSSRSDPSQAGKALPKGRTVLVPGFMAGLEAAHSRFGKLPFPKLFEPAIELAREGFPISERLAQIAESQRHIFARLPESRTIFTRKDGSTYQAGETFKQPALAKTLKKVAEHGAAYFYRGAWAKKFVEAVRRDGGKMTLEDLARYRPTWHEPAPVGYRDHEIYLASGGGNVAGMLHLLELSGLDGDYAGSAGAFFRFCSIVKAVNFGAGLEGLEYGQEEWADRAFAERAWKHLNHSAAVVVVDGKGNVAALLHSSNTVGCGETGLYVDGVSVPDSATFQQVALSYTEPGERLFNPTAPLVALKDGRPVLGLSAIGSGIYEETIKVLYNLIGLGRPVQEAIDAPSIVPYFGQQVDSPSVTIAIAEGAYPAAVVDGARGMGLEIQVLPERDARRRKGAVAAITVDTETGIREAGSARRFSLGY